MANVLVVYATTEGQTAKIAEHIAAAGRSLGHEVTVRHAPDLPDDADLTAFQGVLLGASLHEGRFQRSIVHFIEHHEKLLASRPSAFFGVSLSAAAQDAQGPAAVMQIIEDLMQKTGWKPAFVESIAGALKYTQYSWLKRALMKQIAKHEGGDTDTSRDFEYTDWDQVTRFAQRFFAGLGDVERPHRSMTQPSN
jgi:menaquinone-dependent protoporphyrinogen oxidase